MASQELSQLMRVVEFGADTHEPKNFMPQLIV